MEQIDCLPSTVKTSSGFVLFAVIRSSKEAEVTPEEFAKENEGQYKTNTYCCYCRGSCHMAWACSHRPPGDTREHNCICELHQAMFAAGIELPEPTRMGYHNNQLYEEIDKIKETCPNCGINLADAWRDRIAELYPIPEVYSISA